MGNSTKCRSNNRTRNVAVAVPTALAVDIRNARALHKEIFLALCRHRQSKSIFQSFCPGDGPEAYKLGEKSLVE